MLIVTMVKMVPDLQKMLFAPAAKTMRRRVRPVAQSVRRTGGSCSSDAGAIGRHSAHRRPGSARPGDRRIPREGVGTAVITRRRRGRGDWRKLSDPRVKEFRASSGTGPP